MISVAVIEDEKDTREMLCALINSDSRFTCVGSYVSAEEAVAALPGLKADVALVDIHLSGSSGIMCVGELKPLTPSTQFVMCTSLEDSDNIFNALQAGATGYLTKATQPEKILDAIQDAYDGGSPMSSQIARKVISFFQAQPPRTASEISKLSSREQEIVTYLSKGHRYKEIASAMFISVETVRKHIHNIYEKLQVNSRTDAINKVFNRT